MPSANRRQAAATATVGYAGVGAGALLSEQGIKQATALSGGKRRRPPSMALLRAPFSLERRNARLKYLGGRGLAAAGGTGAAAGTLEYFHHRKQEQAATPVIKAGFVTEGLRGNADALRQKKDNFTQPVPLKVRAIPVASGAVVGGLAGTAVHRTLDHTVFHASKLRPAAVAVGATAAISGSLPLTSRLAHHLAPGYRVTATGVSRTNKTKIKRASSKASVAEGRSSQGADPRMFRQQVVGKAAQPLPWPGMSRARFARVFDSKKPGRVRLIPAHHLQGANSTLLRNGDGHYIHGLAQDMAANGQHDPIEVSAYNGRINEGQHRVQAALMTGSKVKANVRTSGDVHARVKQLKAKQGIGKMNDASEVHVNTTMRRTGRKLRMPIPYEVNQRVRKLDSGMTREQARAQLHAKKRKLITDVVSTGLGTGGLALLAASSKHSPVPKHLHAALRQGASTTAVLGGGVGAINGIQGVRISHRDIKAQEKVVKGMRVPSFRGSYLQTRRLRNGTIRPVRVNGGVVR